MHPRRAALGFGLFVLAALTGQAIAADLLLKPVRPAQRAAPASAGAARSAECHLPGMDGRLPGLSARGERRDIVLQRRHRLRAESGRVHAALSSRSLRLPPHAQ